MGESFGVVARFSITDACFELEDTFEEVHDLVETPLEGSHDVFVHMEFPSLDFNNIVSHNPIDHSHVSPICSLPSLSPENPMIFDANIDLGYEDNMFSMLGGSIDDYVSRGYVTGHECMIPSLILIVYA